MPRRKQDDIDLETNFLPTDEEIMERKDYWESLIQRYSHGRDNDDEGLNWDEISNDDDEIIKTDEECEESPKKHRRVVRKDSPEGKLSFHISDEVLAGMKEIYRQRLEEVEKMNLPFWNQTSTSTEYTHFRQTTQTNSQNIPMNFQSPLMIEYPQMNQNHPSTSQQPLHNMLTMNSPLVLQQMMSNPNFTVTIREREYNFSSRFQSEIAAIRAPVSSDVSLQFLQPSRAIAPPELKRKVGRLAKSRTETKLSCKEHKPVDDPKNGKNDPTVNKKVRDEARRKAIFDDDSSSEDDNNKQKTVQRGKIDQMPEGKAKKVVNAKLGKVQQDALQFNPFDDE